MIQIDDLEYQSKLAAAATALMEFVSSFDLTQIGLTDLFKSSVCPQSDEKLLVCLNDSANDKVMEFYEECIRFIDNILPKGKEELTNLLG